MARTCLRRRRVISAVVLWPLCLALAAPLAAQSLGRRGDATCSDDLSAADIVATVRGTGGDSVCDADDCDRDGAVTAADVACAAGCLFGYCPVPAHAPRLTAIAADSAPEIVPGSVVRLAVANLGPIDASKRVVVGGLEAEVLEQTATELLVALPAALPTGPAELVVVDGDLPGPPIEVEIAPALPLGPPDSFDDMLGLVDTLLARLLDLDVETAFGDGAPIIREELGRYRQELAAQRAALAVDPDLDEAARLALDAAADGSGAPEALRATIAEVETLAAGEGGPAASVNREKLAFQAGARTIQIVGGVARAAAGVATRTAIATPVLGLIAAGLVIHGGVILALEDPVTPLITGIDYLDADGRPRHFPTAGGIAVIRGHNFDTFTTHLSLQTASGAVLATEATAVGDRISYRLPADRRFCGKVTLRLLRTVLAISSNSVPSRVQPELLSLESDRAAIGSIVQGISRGLGHCDGATQAHFDGAVRGTALVGVNNQGVTAAVVPSLLPGSYRMGLSVEGLRSDVADDRALQVLNSLTGLSLSCPARLALPDSGEAGVVSTCDAAVVPQFSAQPMPSRFRWVSSQPNVARIEDTTSGSKSTLTPRNVGTTNISVVLESTAGSQSALASSAIVPVTVVDDSKPRISISSGVTSPVQPGATIPVTITASDNARLLTVSLTATGDAVASGGSQEILDCAGQRTCTATADITLRESGFSQSTVTISASARDVGANTAGSNTLTFTIARDTTCPTVSIQQPAAGGSVNAGETIQVVATASDAQPGDTGVKSFVYSASGPALVAPVAQTLPLPMPQANPTLRFNFTVKQPSELTDVEDKSITIAVEALDAAQPPNTCGPQTISVGVVGVLDRCNGGITTDNPDGYIGEAFTITVALAGADDVVRVTSINPGGQFDLQPRGGGVYTVTLFYQGRGGFTLRFIAFDAAGEERCSGSIALTALGPRPDAGVAAQRRGSEPAGGSLR